MYNPSLFDARGSMEQGVAVPKSDMGNAGGNKGIYRFRHGGIADLIIKPRADGNDGITELYRFGQFRVAGEMKMGMIKKGSTGPYFEQYM